MHERHEKRVFKLFLIGEILCALLIAGTVFAVAVFSPAHAEENILIGTFATVCCLAVSFMILQVFRHFDNKNEIRKPSGPVLGSIMYDTVNNSDEPAIICDENSKIIWYNKYAQTASGTSSPLLGTKLSSLITAPVADSSDGNKKHVFTSTLGKKNYIIESTKIRSTDKVYHLLMFRDITEINDLKTFIKEEEKVVAYIIVDNLEELLQFEQEKYREAAARIEVLVREWAASVGGIIKEYERDKYLFIFKVRDLEKFVEEKFDILDKIRDIRVGNGNIPVTVSIGVAKTKGDLADKEKSAHIALDMALQRGGDQAVVKYDDRIEFFGGRTNAVHKRTKVRARVASNELLNYMASASNVIIMAHKYPDYDAFGSSIGIARLAMFCGVKVNIVTNPKDANVKRCMKFFENDEKYKGIFVDASKGLDLVKSRTLLVITDVNNRAMFESPDIYDNVYKVIIIDHHRKTEEFAKKPVMDYIEPSSSSASELVTEMLEQTLPPSTLQHNEADMLLAGMLLDTKQFTKGTGTKTYAAAMYLRDNGASYEDVQDLFKTSIKEYRTEANFGQKVEIYRHCMAIAVNENGAEETDRILAARVADNLLMVDEVAASFALVQVEDTIHISARSNGTVNVQLILEELKGGGRYDAAGAQIKNTPMAQTLLKLKDAIDKYLDPED